MKEEKEEVEIIKDCWRQWAYDGKDGFFSGGLRVLESIESYLRKKGLIDKKGNLIEL